MPCGAEAQVTMAVFPVSKPMRDTLGSSETGATVLHLRAKASSSLELLASSSLLPSSPKISPHLSSMTAFHAASQRSQAEFPNRKTGFANVATCAMRPSEPVNEQQPLE